MNSVSDLNCLLRQYERISHLRSDLQQLVSESVISKRSWLTNASNFGKKKHSYLYKVKSDTSTPLIKYDLCRKDLSRIGHCSQDVQDYLILTMFSSPSHTHVSSFGPSKHDFLRNLTAPKSPSSQSRVQGQTKRFNVTKLDCQTTVKTESQVLNDAQILSRLSTHQRYYGVSTTPSFSKLFPNTEWPKITLVLGTPKIDRELFNSLLVSTLRAAKSALRADGSKIPTRFGKNVVLAFSRMIDRSLKIELSSRRSVLPVNKTIQKQLKDASRSKKIEIATAAQKFLSTKGKAFVPAKTSDVSTQVEIAPLTPSPPPVAQVLLTHPNSFSHLSQSDLSLLQKMLASTTSSMRSKYFTTPTGSDTNSHLKGPFLALLSAQVIDSPSSHKALFQSCGMYSRDSIGLQISLSHTVRPSKDEHLVFERRTLTGIPDFTDFASRLSLDNVRWQDLRSSSSILTITSESLTYESHPVVNVSSTHPL